MERLRSLPLVLAGLNRRASVPLNDDRLAEVQQDVALALWHERYQLAAGTNLTNWIHHVAKLALLEAVRSRIRAKDRRHRYATQLEERYTQPPDLVRWEAVDSLVQALTRLGSPDADVIRLKHYEEQTFTEVGRSLGVSPNTAKFWYYRGMRKLRRWLGPFFLEPLP